jgi:hypothetical protein
LRRRLKERSVGARRGKRRREWEKRGGGRWGGRGKRARAELKEW